MKRFDIVIITWFLIVLVCILFGSNTEGQRVLNAVVVFGGIFIVFLIYGYLEEKYKKVNSKIIDWFESFYK